MPITENYFRSSRQLDLESDVSLACWLSEYGSTNYSDNLFHIYNIEFPQSLETASTKRKAEFIAGRYTAQKALNLLGEYDNSILVGPRRCPVWPNGIVGSISHTSRMAVSVVAARNECEAIGIDIEDYIAPDKLHYIADNVMTSHEKSILDRIHMPSTVATTLVFSAKESLFKALNPLVNSYFSFDAAQISNISVINKSCTIKLVQDLSSTICSGRSFVAKYILRDSCLITSVCVNKGAT